VIRGRWGKSGLVVVVFALLLATTAPTAVGTVGDGSVSPSSSDATEDPSSFDAAQQDPPEENNSSVAHRNPSEVSDDESLADVELWLSREMAEQLSESAEVSDEDRERVRELVGDDSRYAELAEQYAEVANRSGSRAGAEQAGEFAAAGQLQRQFFADVERYHRVHDAYRNARANDEANRSLRLAHELERQAADVNRTAARLNESYANISAEEQGNLRNATLTIGELRANVTRTQQTVRDQTLVRTELSVEATRLNGAFTDPIPLEGRLRTADGDPIADENVTLRVGNRTLNAITDEEGRFEVEYRPTHATVGERPRTVAFRPANDSEYLWANANVTFGVRQTTPDVTISNRTETVRYNDTLTVNGSVAAEGVGVPDVPVVVTVDGVRVARVRTNADGSFGAAGRLPGNVSNGSQTVRVQVVPENETSGAFGPDASGPGGSRSNSLGPDSDRDGASGVSDQPARDVAIAPANGSAAVSVEATTTSLSIADVQTFNGTALVAGRLTTESGDLLGNRTVELRIDDQTVGTATTNATGGFATTVGLPSRLRGDDSTVRIVATYSPPGGNLGPATADRTVTVGSTGAAVSDRQLRFGAAGLLALAALGAFVWRWRSSGGASDAGETGADAGSGEGGDSRASEFADVRERSVEALFDSATTALDDGRLDAAVVAAYAAVRRRFENARGLETNGNGRRLSGDGLRTRGVESRAPRTHWEFYVACRDAGLSEERRRRLERLTEIYERAAFADESVSEADAREAVADARALREAAESDAGPPGGEFRDGERFGREQSDSDSGDVGGSPAA
jgi:hypothetical protein